MVKIYGAFANDAGWFVNYIKEYNITKLKTILGFKLAKWFNIIDIPIQDQAQVAVVTLQRQA